MRFWKRALALSSALSLSLSLAAVSGEAQEPPVTTNPLRDNVEGTVPIIKVTTSLASDVARCDFTCSNRLTGVTIYLDSNDPNTGRLRSAPANQAGLAVDVWWITDGQPATGSEPANLLTTDCTKASNGNGSGRHRLGQATFDVTGKASITSITLPPGATWDYGVNWICATTVSPGGVGAIGDLAFTTTP